LIDAPSKKACIGAGDTESNPIAFIARKECNPHLIVKRRYCLIWARCIKARMPRKAAIAFYFHEFTARLARSRSIKKLVIINKVRVRLRCVSKPRVAHGIAALFSD